MTKGHLNACVISGAALLAGFTAAAVLAQNAATTSTIAVNPAERFQTIDGFGVNFNGTYFRDAQKPMVDMLIDDLGATIFRLDPYGLLNWEAANDNDNPQVMNWEYYFTPRPLHLSLSAECARRNLRREVVEGCNRPASDRLADRVMCRP